MIPGIVAGGGGGPSLPVGAITGYLPGLALNESYSRQLLADNATSWSITSGALPTGLSINSSGLISGVVPVGTTLGNYTFEVTASGFGAPSTRSFTIGLGKYISLLHMNGANNSTTFTDQTGKTWTASGNAKIITDAAALGGSQGTFDGNGDYLTTADHADWTLGTQDWTLEFYVTLAANVGAGTFPGIIGQRTNTSTDHSFTFYLQPPSGTNNLHAAFNNSSVDLNSAKPLVATARTHVSWSRRGNRIFLHFDGVQSYAANFTTNVSNSGQSVRIAAFDNPVFSGSYLNGKLNEFRFMVGASRYAEADTFTPSTDVVLSNFPVV